MLNNMVALVTGSSRGIGQAIVQKLAYYNADVVITYNTKKSQAERLQIELQEKGTNALVLQLNLKDERSIINCFRQIEENFGRLDILVNNAGIGRPKSFEEITLEEWNEGIDINLTGAFLSIKYSIPLLKKSKEGRIINVSSVAALTGGSFGPHYGASKAGLIGLTKSAARELAKNNISVNVVAPGPIDSEMTNSLSSESMRSILNATPMNRLGAMGEVAELICQLANPKIGYITGQTIVMDGGRYMH